MNVSLTGTANPFPNVTIAANFQGLDDATFGLASIPDTNGAVGPDRFVEFINGAFRVYDQSGSVQQTLPLDEFWRIAGVTPVFAFDPRVLYDPTSGRWFASAADGETAPGNVLFAVSKTSDPTQGWTAFSFPASDTGNSWADFPTLGLNQDGVFLSFSASADGQPVIAIPMADLLQSVPSVANATAFYFSGELGHDALPAVAFGSLGSELLAANFFNFFQSASVDGPVKSPLLDTADRTLVFPDGIPFGNPPPAIQKGTDIGLYIRLGDQFTSSVVYQDGKLFGARTINVGNRDAVQWLEIGDPLTSPTLLGSGIIQPAGLDAFNPSIAVNPLGEAVIGFTASGPNEYASAYAVAGMLNGNTIQFGDPILLKAGESSFGNANVLTPAWGDYSATTFDPGNPSHFWTIQEYAASPTDDGLHWADQISELIFHSAVPTTQTWVGGTGDFAEPSNWMPQGLPAATDRLVIGSGRVQVDELIISNSTIQLGSSQSTPTLTLQDSTLTASNRVEVQTTSFDPAEPELHAGIRAIGAVIDDGAIDVGTSGSQSFPAHLAVNIARESSFTLGSTGTWVSRDGSTIDVNARGADATFVNNGTIQALGSTVTMTVPVSGQGIFDVGANSNGTGSGTVEFRESVASDETVRLDSGTLKLDEPMRFLGSIDGFSAESRIELVNTKVTRADYDNGVLKLFNGHQLAAVLDLVGNFVSSQFQLGYEHGNTFITLDAFYAEARAG